MAPTGDPVIAGCAKGFGNKEPAYRTDGRDKAQRGSRFGHRFMLCLFVAPALFLRGRG